MSHHIRNRILAIFCLVILLSVVLLPTTLAKYVLTDTGSTLLSKIIGNVYTITYYNGSEIYKVEYVWNNAQKQSLIGQPNRIPDDVSGSGGEVRWNGWKYLNGSNTITEISAGNTANVVLYADWYVANRHTIRFVDADATLLYQEMYLEGATSISAAGQTKIAQILSSLEDEVNKDSDKTKIKFEITWEEYTLKNAKDDITVRALYTLLPSQGGSVSLKPFYDPATGQVLYYQVVATSGLTGEITVPGMIGPIPVAKIEDISADSLNTEMTKITFMEGVEEIGRDALAMTSGLKVVELPNSLEKLGTNAFASTAGGAIIQKTLTIKFSGTSEEWDAIVDNSDVGWEKGLATGTTVECSDGVYTLKATEYLVYSKYEWTWTAKTP